MPEPERLPLHFGPFQWIPAQQSLLFSGQPVRMSGAATKILGLLLERPGTLVSTKRILRVIWPDAAPQEATLRGYVSALRKILRAGLPENDCVQNVIGQGYRFAAPVTAEAPFASHEGSAPDNLPPAPKRLFGRAHLIAALAARLENHRLITLVGAAGIGKTSVAVATASQLRAVLRDGVRFVDLGSVSVPSKVAGAVACALGLQSISTQPLAQILQYVKDRHLLIVLDNCEHVIDAAAHLAEALLNGAPHLRVLATSRESLRAQGEWVSRLLSLELPAETATLTAAAALRFPAIQLFVDSAVRAVPEFKLRNRDASSVAEICRQLDGLPLALQLAAAQVERLEIQGLAAALQGSLEVLSSARPVAIPRHATLRATLDWSYRLLPESEQCALNELGIFAGRFDAASAHVILSESPRQQAAVMNLLGDLAGRSLLTVGECCGHVTYQLLATTRAYVIEKLQVRPDIHEVRRRHARMCCSWDYPWARSVEVDRRDWREMASIRIDEVRAALDWCFSPQGDAMLGAELAAESAPLWFALSMLEEHRDYLERALATTATVTMAKQLHLKLHSALGNAIIYTRGPVQIATVALRAAAMACAEQNGDTEDQLGVLWGLWVDRIVGSDYEAALELSERYRRLESTEPVFLRGLMLDLMIAITRHLAGDQRTARQHAQKIVQSSDAMPAVRGDDAFHFDYRVSSRAVLGPILYLQGQSDQALQTARESIDIAWNIGHTLSLCCALMHGCTVALWAGELDLAKHAAACLLEQSTEHRLNYWQAWAHCLGIALAQQQRDACVAEELRQFCKEPMCTGLHLETLGTFAPSLATAKALERAETGSAGWSTPELLRVKAERILSGQAADIPTAEALLRNAINIARKQDALAWELRAATSLARLVSSRGQRADAVILLQPLLHRCRLGGMSRDTATAAKLLQELQTHTGSCDHHFAMDNTTRLAGNE
jgi:predicted ATPase/DNA-binding winged helix-turn-helix (wHTH) protein